MKILNLLFLILLSGCSYFEDGPTMYSQTEVDILQLEAGCYFTLKSAVNPDSCGLNPYSKVCPCNKLDALELKEKFSRYKTTTKHGRTYIGKCFKDRIRESIVTFEPMTFDNNNHTSMVTVFAVRYQTYHECDADNPNKCIKVKQETGWTTFRSIEYTLQESRMKEVACPK